MKFDSLPPIAFDGAKTWGEEMTEQLVESNEQPEPVIIDCITISVQVVKHDNTAAPGYSADVTMNGGGQVGGGLKKLKPTNSSIAEFETKSSNMGGFVNIYHKDGYTNRVKVSFKKDALYKFILTECAEKR